MHIQRPFIETMNEQPEELLPYLPRWEIENLIKRRDDAKIISEHIVDKNDKAYDALARIMTDYPRIALYVPLWMLKFAPEEFYDPYLEAWRKCWPYRDIAETFNIGDVLEKGTYWGKPRRVVKAMHLVPWLVEYGYLTFGDIISIFRCMGQDEILAESLFDAVIYMRQEGMITDDDYNKAMKFKPNPRYPFEEMRQIYESDARKQWLDEKAHNYYVGKDFQLKNPAGPFSKNIQESDLYGKINLQEGKYCLIGGSHLKGYGRNRSDFDVYIYDKKSGTINGFEPYAGRPTAISHLLLDTLWVGTDEEDTKWTQYGTVCNCIEELDQAKHISCLVRMEMDLLQFRLMHKGIICAYPDLFKDQPETSPIDIGSAFYKDAYREIAVQLYAKYIVLPKEFK